MNSIKYILLAVLFFSFNCSADKYNPTFKKIFECSHKNANPFVAHIEIFMDKNLQSGDKYVGHVIINSAIPKLYIAIYWAEPQVEYIKYGRSEYNSWKYGLIIKPDSRGLAIDLSEEDDINMVPQYKCRKPTS